MSSTEAKFDLAGALREAARIASYPAIGHHYRSRRWDPAELSVDMTGKVCVVTGGSAGLGLAIARGLGRRGATVVIVCRDEARGEAARRAVATSSGHDRVVLLQADLSSVESVRSLAGRLVARFPRLDVLVNNAGASHHERELSTDGLEMTFAANTLGGFLLTSLLLPSLIRSAPSRIIHMTSSAAYVQRLDVDALVNNDRGRYDGAVTYARSKRAILELNTIWVERLAGTGVTSSCVHPGLSATPGVERGFPLYHRWFGPALRDADQGADTAVWLAVSPAVSGRTGELWFDREARPAHIVPWTRSPRSEVERLWATCAALGSVSTHGGLL